MPTVTEWSASTAFSAAAIFLKRALASGPLRFGIAQTSSSPPPRPIALGPQQNVLPTRVRVLLQIVQTSQRITTLRATITKRGSPITILRRSQPRRRTLVAQDRHRGPVATRPLPRQRGPVISDR